MKVIVDQDRCEGNGVCESCCPEVFRLPDDADKVILLMETVPDNLRSDVESAVDGCPRQALSLQE
jgi:ferredoxin